MDKYFVCLANSYKHGGRCIAGVEVVPEDDGQLSIVRHDDGRPRWIRPISMSENGEIPNHLAEDFELLSLIKLTDVVPCPDKAHAEDVHCSRMECCTDIIAADKVFLNQLVDPVHQAVFRFRGKVISTTLFDKLNYSLMMIQPDSASAYVDEKREKSKHRMIFTYRGSNYDFPITDPYFLERFKKNPEKYKDLKGVYLALSLGLEFEGYHYKLVASVLFPSDQPFEEPVLSAKGNGTSYMEQQKQMYSNAYAKWSQEEDLKLVELYNEGASIGELMEKFGRNEGAIRARLKKLTLEQDDKHWFTWYENELIRLIDLKKDVEEQINALRKDLIEQMESHGEEQVKTRSLTVTYTPPKTVMQFDSKSFRAENEELYSRYCQPRQKGAYLIVRLNNKEKP